MDFQEQLKKEMAGYERLKEPSFIEKQNAFLDKLKPKSEPMSEAEAAYWDKVGVMPDKDKFNLSDALSQLKFDNGRQLRFSNRLVNIAPKEAWQLLLAIGRQKYGEKFEVDSEQIEVYQHILLYFLGHQKSKYDLNKGLLLYGNVGRGKSAIFNIMNLVCKYCHIDRMQFQTVSAVSLPFEIQKSKDEGSIAKYFKGLWLFDDIGQEEPEYKMFGNSIFIIEEIFTHRYNNFVRSGHLTHITTNYPPAALQGKYGDRVSSRFKEMFNFIEVVGEDKRK